MANEVGKRYRCPKCGAEFIFARGGTAPSTAVANPWN
ncbi:hypothetical protein ES703_18113 [subsurface metagenome]